MRQPEQPDQTRRRISMPIIVIGCARSATTLLGRFLSRHPNVAFWHEPRSVWMYGHAYRSHDELDAGDLTPRIARHIDRKFSWFVESSGKQRFAEKTPSNCFRIAFIHALFPDCRIVNIIRDGRNVVRSMLKIREGAPTAKRLRRRIAHTSVWEWPAYAPRLLRMVWQTKVLRRPNRYWGPMPRQWREWRNLPPHILAAEQWRAAVAASIRDGRSLPSSSYLEIRYETLMESPIEVVSQILEFAELAPADAVTEYASQTIDPNRTHRWKGLLTDRQEMEVEERLSPLLAELGYIKAPAAEVA